MIPATVSSALFCPKCASPAVEYSMLDGGDGACSSCGWRGLRRDLLLSPFEQSVSVTDDEIIVKFERDVRNAIARDLSLLVARLLKTWGFLHGNERVQGVLLGRYMRGIGKAVVLAILEERKKIEHERVAAQIGKSDVR